MAQRERHIPLSQADAAWLHMETPTNLMTITGLFYLDSSPSAEALSKVVADRLLSSERFSMRAREPAHGIGLPHWEHYPGFDLSHHLVWEELPQPTHRALMQRAGEFMGQPLNRERALWEFRVFPQVDDGAAILVRIHHAIADGMALMRVLLNLADDEQGHHSQPLKQARETDPKSVFTRAKQSAHHLLQESHDLLFYPKRALTAAARGVAVAQSLARLAALKPDPPTPLRGPLSGEKRTAVSPLLQLARVKAVGGRFDCTINDVLMACLTRALSLQICDREKLEPDMNLRAVVPVDLRGGDVDALGNRFGMVFLELPVGTHDPVSRLRVVHQRMEDLKSSVEAIVVYEILNAVGLLPGEMEQQVVKFFADKATAVVTNLPGPRQQLYLAGRKIESLMYWVPQSGSLGLGVSLMSYNGTVRIGVASDNGLVTQPDKLVRDFQLALKELEDLETVSQ